MCLWPGRIQPLGGGCPGPAAQLLVKVPRKDPSARRTAPVAATAASMAGVLAIYEWERGKHSVLHQAHYHWVATWRAKNRLKDVPLFNR